MTKDKVTQAYIIQNYDGRYCKGTLSVYKKGNHNFVYYIEQARMFYTKTELFRFITNVLASRGGKYYKEINIVKLAVVELACEKLSDIIDINKNSLVRNNSNNEYYFCELQSAHEKVFSKPKNDQTPTQTT